MNQKLLILAPDLVREVFSKKLILTIYLGLILTTHTTSSENETKKIHFKSVIKSHQLDIFFLSRPVAQSRHIYFKGKSSTVSDLGLMVGLL